MTIRGKFIDSFGPCIAAVLEIPRLDVSGPLALLVDTGSPYTVLLPGGAEYIGVELEAVYSEVDPIEAPTVGGPVPVWLEKAVLHLVDERGDLIGFDLTVCVAPRSTHETEHMGLLGRDILDQLTLLYDRRSERLTLDP